MERRTLLKTLPFVGLAATSPTAIMAPSPDERIAHAQEVIRQALAEKYDGWQLHVKRPQLGHTINGQTQERRVSSEIILIGAMEPTAFDMQFVAQRIFR